MKLIDFGLAKMYEDEKSFTKTQCGTPMYMAPEVLDNAGHNKNVDWWGVGCLIYEMLFGQTPFWDKRATKMQNKIRKGEFVFPDKVKYAQAIPYSDDVEDLIKALLNTNKNARLGSSKEDWRDVLKHKWFSGTDIVKYENKEVVPPFKPDFDETPIEEFFNVQRDQSKINNTRITPF